MTLQMQLAVHSILHLVCHSISFSHLNKNSPFNGTYYIRLRELDNRLGFEIGEMTLQMQKDVLCVLP